VYKRAWPYFGSKMLVFSLSLHTIQGFGKFKNQDSTADLSDGDSNGCIGSTVLFLVKVKLQMLIGVHREAIEEEPDVRFLTTDNQANLSL
jgi:hypothetical protein